MDGLIPVLLVDDDPNLRQMLQIVLEDEGYRVLAAEGGLVALDILRREPVQLVLSDIKMPDMNGLALLEAVRRDWPELPVIMITAYASTQDAVLAMKQGASDYLTKPFDLDEIRLVIQRTLEKKGLYEENRNLKRKLARMSEQIGRGSGDLVGRSACMQALRTVIASIAPTDATVLIQGESGTGKELAARMIHRRSVRAQGPFVALNCGALPENLLESELFGYQKGAFTDAVRDKPGLFETAGGGTLFLDEVGEMSQAMQVKLLRTLQEHTVRRLGGDREIMVDVRLVSATNRNLEEAVADGAFRSDLFYRLNVIPLNMPPLRDRRDDIPLLAQHFVSRSRLAGQKGIRGFAQGALDSLMEHDWPGNVRELENLVERALALGTGEWIDGSQLEGWLPRQGAERASSGFLGMMGVGEIRKAMEAGQFDLTQFQDEWGRLLVQMAMDLAGNNGKLAAERLQVTYRSFRYLLDKFGVRGQGSR